jgi:hypothetical protein
LRSGGRVWLRPTLAQANLRLDRLDRPRIAGVIGQPSLHSKALAGRTVARQISVEQRVIDERLPPVTRLV